MKIVFFVPVLILAIASCKPPAATSTSGNNTVTEALPDTNQVTLNTLKDSVSYCVGVSVVNYYKQMGVTELNTTLISKAINDILGGKKPILNDSITNIVMNNYLNKLQAEQNKILAEKSKPNIAAGEAFLAQNKLRAGVITTPSGLQYEVIREGTGVKPGPTDNVTCHYKGTLLDGTEVDNSYARNQPLTFALNRVIKGWTEGLQLMSVGSKYKFYIPYTIGYGDVDYGTIPGGSVLTFEIELLDVKK